LPAVFAAVMLLFPEPVAQARFNLESRPWRSLFLGLLTFAAVALLTALLFGVIMMAGEHGYESEPIFVEFVASILVITLGVPLLIGLSAAVQLISHRLGELNRPILTYLRGGGLLFLACLVPFVGWLVFTPLLVWTSIGAVVGLLKRRKRES